MDAREIVVGWRSRILARPTVPALGIDNLGQLGLGFSTAHHLEAAFGVQVYVIHFLGVSAR